MIKQLLSAIAIIVLLGSCSSLKPLNFISSKQTTSAEAVPENTPVKFIDDINVTAKSGNTSKEIKSEKIIVKEESHQKNDVVANLSDESENVSALQLKYAGLLSTSPEQLQNKALFSTIDDWYGTRYKMGGTTRKGIDCSAFVCTIYATVFGISLPRTARDQYQFTRRVPRTELKEGDLIFFNTRGGVSHVGIYLQNNKFVHASTSNGVTISDMFEPYYLQRFIGAGRVKNKEPLAFR